MTQVDFYVTPETDGPARFRVAARLIEKALGRGHRLFVNLDNAASAENFDMQLWGFREASFIPHALVTDDPGEQVVIGWGQDPEYHSDVLINLDRAVPTFFSRFHRVAEIVTREPEHLVAMRDTWRYYRDRGYPLKKHDLPTP